LVSITGGGVVIRRWAEQSAVYLQTELNLEPARVKVLAYGLEAVMGGLTTWAAAGTAALFRLPTGGAHCRAFDRCLISSLGTFMLAGTAGVMFARQVSSYLFPFVLVILCVAALATVFYVPADTSSRPIVDRREKLRLKAWAFSVLGLYLPLYLSFRHSIAPELVLAGGMGLLIQTITLTPWGYLAIQAMDRFLATLLGIFKQRGEVKL
jgi:accessory gene regulator B